MSTSSNPPQLQLSLGLPPPHHAFKRSFHQFGLDVDDAEDPETSVASSAGSSSASSVSTGGSANRSVSGSSGAGSVFSGSSYRSQTAGDVYGHYSSGERNERNKRARSEGPDSANTSVMSSAGASEEGSVGLGSHAVRPPALGARQGQGQGPSQASGEYDYSTASNTGVDLSSWTVPSPSLSMPSFGPPTPQVAEFAATRVSAGAFERAPGFSAMLSPRLSSPVPPPAEELDITMHDDEDREPSRLFSFSYRELDSPARLGATAERLRASVARARAFDRSIEPLRSDALDGLAAHSQDAAPHSRLPPFDFEAHRRRASPAIPITMFGGSDSANANTGASTGVSNPFDQDHSEYFTSENTHSSYFSRSTPMSSSASNIDSISASDVPSGRSTGVDGSFASARATNLNNNVRRNGRPSPEPMRFTIPSNLADDDDEEDEMDDIDVDRELAEEDTPPRVEVPGPGGDANRLQRSGNISENTGSGTANERSLFNRISYNRDETSAVSSLEDIRTIENFFEAAPLRNLANRINASDGERNSENRDSAPFAFRRDLRPLREFAAAESSENVLRRTGVPSSPQSAYADDLHRSSSNGSVNGRAAIRPVSHPNPRWDRMLMSRGAQGQTEQTSVNTGRTQTWQWSPLLVTDRDLRTGPGSGAHSHTQPQAHSHSYSLPLPTSFGSGSADAERETQNERIDRMVHLDMGMNVHSHLLSHTSTHAHAQMHTSQSRAPSANPPSRPILPTLRSAIFGPLDGADALSDLLREEREEWGEDRGMPTSASASAIAPSSSSSGLRARGNPVNTGSRIGHNAERQSRLDLNRAIEQTEIFSQHQMQHRREEHMSFTGRLRQEAAHEPLSPLSQLLDLPPITIGDLHRPSPSGRSILDSEEIRSATNTLMTSLLNLQNLDHDHELEVELERGREHERRREWERRRDELERVSGSSPSVVAERPRLREMREVNRLPIRSRSFVERTAMDRRAEEPAPSQRQRLPFTTDTPAPPPHWRHSVITSSMPITNLLSANRYLAPEAETGTSTGSAMPSSTEAAAFFASGPSYGPARRTHARESPALLRQRRLRLLSGLEGNTQSGTRSDTPTLLLSEGDQDGITDFSRFYGLGRGLRRSPSPSARAAPNTNSPGHELLQLLYPTRFSGDVESAGQRRSVENLASSPLRSIDDFDFHDTLPQEERPATWEWSPPHTQELGSLAGQTQRGTTVRSTSRPPSLPPLRFDRLSSFSPEREMQNAESRPSETEDFGLRVAPWRRSGSRLDASAHTGSAWSPTRRTTAQRSSELALHRAMLLQSVQARHTQAHEAEREGEPAAATPGRSQSFQHAMSVLSGDGLTNSRRQQFTSAYERERERTHPPRIDTHVRWGEIVEDDAESRSPSWMDSFRRRRSSTSALFAPPPDNADNAPPNRSRGVGTGTGNHSTGQSLSTSSMHDWFAMISAGRARARVRARLGRHDEDAPSSRPFLGRFVRRSNLRNLGDFMRDEDFDTSYESLIALAATLGEARPRATPAHIISALPTGLYKDWQTPDSDIRCPICLDDYKDVDPVLKAEPCNHWCHKECLEQWLHSARTCPVCRTKINSSQRVPTPPPVAGPSRTNQTASSSEGSDDSDDEFSFFRPPPSPQLRAMHMHHAGNLLRPPS